ncbi:hypothetical protein K1719_042528 [Acacia pycnantha]|nr:hypothetical protein K1719_042528 [Acacia pycnantha]
MKAKLASSNGDIPKLPLHIVEEIFNNLDVQTLFKSSFVCKDWNKLITSPDFMFRSSSFGSRNQILLIKVCYCRESAQNLEREYIHFPYCRVTYSVHWDNNQFDLSHVIENNIDDFKGTGVIGASNGLICLANNMPLKFILWNPTIRKYAWLPLMMDWDLRFSILGFGFDCSSNNFKIVNIISCPSIYNWTEIYNWSEGFDSVWVFSYTTWSWKRLTYGSMLHSCSIYHSKPNVYFNGIIHWIAHSNEINRDVILTFDLSREIFGQILLPKDAQPDFCLNFVATTGDLLLLTQFIPQEGLDDDSECHFDTWTMKQYGNQESWTKSSSLGMKMKMGPDHVLNARKNGDLILEMEEGQIYRYNPASATDVLLVGTMENSVFFRYHTESLYLLEKDEEVNSY